MIIIFLNVEFLASIVVGWPCALSQSCDEIVEKTELVGVELGLDGGVLSYLTKHHTQHCGIHAHELGWVYLPAHQKGITLAIIFLVIILSTIVLILLLFLFFPLRLFLLSILLLTLLCEHVHSIFITLHFHFLLLLLLVHLLLLLLLHHVHLLHHLRVQIRVCHLLAWLGFRHGHRHSSA